MYYIASRSMKDLNARHLPYGCALEGCEFTRRRYMVSSSVVSVVCWRAVPHFVSDLVARQNSSIIIKICAFQNFIDLLSEICH